MPDPRIDKMAGLLVKYSVAVGPRDTMLVTGDILAKPLLKAVYAKVLQSGGFPMMMISIPDADKLLFRYTSDEQFPCFFRSSCGIKCAKCANRMLSPAMSLPPPRVSALPES